MRCDTYRDDLLEVAAAPQELKEQVRVHVEECPQCRATLQRERTLFAKIDEALRARVEEMPRVGFLADVRARISQEPEPRALMNPVWILATTSVMVAMLAMVAPWTRLRREPVAPSGPILSTTHPSPEAKVAESKTVELPHAGIHRQGKRQIVALAAAREPEVLVPPDEREALARFITHLSERGEVVVAFASPALDEKNEPAEIRPLEVAQLQVKPLKWERWVLVTNATVEEER
jgi:hypothetical protein